jgi:hypothetical protein
MGPALAAVVAVLGCMVTAVPVWALLLLGNAFGLPWHLLTGLRRTNVQISERIGSESQKSCIGRERLPRRITLSREFFRLAGRAGHMRQKGRNGGATEGRW